MSQKPLEKALPFYLQIQQTIKERIWHGEYKPGDRLYEAQLAKQFFISRSPVREAIRTLINEGLLIMDEKSQITVYKPTLKDVKDIYGCRIALESAAVALAAERATGSQIAELERILAGTETAIKQNDKEEIVKWNTKFHEQIILISENVRLKKLVDELHSLTYYYRLLNIEGNERGQTILKGHKEIFNAIRERDPEKAAQSLMQHTQEDLKNLIKLIEGKGEN
ncbi:GntR family transcriptional regulator [Cytobacillus oceanisediminis]|uniref:GntR family transcriptional regulator n=1 Tax=Cytobacillus oceanisediminis TaxID=665099 RepID=A0A2V2ZMD6_9BACI|nr:GntR family transcriptional regulator [Cytobacillus oceanisediminis]PWW20834.1 GntR family transcriptional regulator [Cytobacillus oceanisediminis]